jgi:hypothetical protein
MLGIMGTKLREQWGKLVKTDFYNSYSIRNIIGIIKTRKMKQAQHVASMAEITKSTQNFS